VQSHAQGLDRLLRGVQVAAPSEVESQEHAEEGGKGGDRGRR
jgi:hypothetical protein